MRDEDFAAAPVCLLRVIHSALKADQCIPVSSQAAVGRVLPLVEIVCYSIIHTMSPLLETLCYNSTRT